MHFRALAALGATRRLDFHTNSRDLHPMHLIARRKIAPGLFAALAQPVAARVLQPVLALRH